MKTLWKGTLNRGGRKPVEFEAEIVQGPDGPLLIERKGVLIAEVPPGMVNTSSYVAALAAAGSAPKVPHDLIGALCHRCDADSDPRAPEYIHEASRAVLSWLRSLSK